MLHHGTSLSEALTTNVAHVRTFSGVRQSVHSLSALRRKSPVARRASEGLFACVNLHVLLQVVLRLGLGAALLADVFLTVQFQVPLEIRSAPELSSTHVTLHRVNRWLVLAINVKTQGTLVGVGSAASLTDKLA